GGRGGGGLGGRGGLVLRGRLLVGGGLAVGGGLGPGWSGRRRGGGRRSVGRRGCGRRSVVCVAGSCQGNLRSPAGGLEDHGSAGVGRFPLDLLAGLEAGDADLAQLAEGSRERGGGPPPRPPAPAGP